MGDFFLIGFIHVFRCFKVCVISVSTNPISEV